MDAGLLKYTLLFVFPALMAFAACSDLLTMKISNRLVILIIIAFFPIIFLLDTSFDVIAWHLGAAALVLTVTFGLFAAGWIGGGDAKLAAATALWLGFDLLLVYLIYASLLGGVLTLLILSVRHYALPLPLMQVTWIERLHNRKTGIPYGIALAAAALIVYPHTLVYQQIVG